MLIRKTLFRIRAISDQSFESLTADSLLEKKKRIKAWKFF
jgi:hypothetical protein